MTPKHIFIINPAAGRCDSTNAVAAAVKQAAYDSGVARI